MTTHTITSLSSKDLIPLVGLQTVQKPDEAIAVIAIIASAVQDIIQCSPNDVFNTDNNAGEYLHKDKFFHQIVQDEIFLNTQTKKYIAKICKEHGLAFQDIEKNIAAFHSTLDQKKKIQTVKDVLDTLKLFSSYFSLHILGPFICAALDSIVEEVKTQIADDIFQSVLKKNSSLISLLQYIQKTSLFHFSIKGSLFLENEETKDKDEAQKVSWRKDRNSLTYFEQHLTFNQEFRNSLQESLCTNTSIIQSAELEYVLRNMSQEEFFRTMFVFNDIQVSGKDLFHAWNHYIRYVDYSFSCSFQGFMQLLLTHPSMKYSKNEVEQQVRSKFHLADQDVITIDFLFEKFQEWDVVQTILDCVQDDGLARDLVLGLFFDIHSDVIRLGLLEPTRKKLLLKRPGRHESMSHSLIDTSRFINKGFSYFKSPDFRSMIFHANKNIIFRQLIEQRDAGREMDLNKIKSDLHDMAERSFAVGDRHMAVIYLALEEYIHQYEVFALPDVFKGAKALLEKSNKVFPDIHQIFALLDIKGFDYFLGCTNEEIEQLACTSFVEFTTFVTDKNKIFDSSRHVLDGSEPGTGKTATAILAAEVLHMKKTLVLSPSGVVGQWNDQITMWTSDNKKTAVILDGKSLDDSNLATQLQQADFIIVGYELLRTNENYQKFIEKMNQLEIDVNFVICDEIHNAKDKNNSTTQIVSDICVDRFPNAKRLLLSGTPIPNSVDDIWAQVVLLYTDKEILDILNVQERLIEETPDPDNTRDVSAYKNLLKLSSSFRLRAFLHDRMNHRGLREILKDFPLLNDLPTDRIDVTDDSFFYEYDVSIEELDNLHNISVDVLKQNASSRKGITDIKVREQLALRPYFADGKKSAKFLALEKNMEEMLEKDKEIDKLIVLSSEYSRVIFSDDAQSNHQYDAVCSTCIEDELRKKYENQGYTVLALSGKSTKSKILRTFENKKKVILLAQLQTIGEGIDGLQESYKMIYLDLPFQPGQLIQSARRIVRRGQKNNMKIKILHGRNTYDNFRREVLAFKEVGIQVYIGNGILNENIFAHLGLEERSGDVYSFANRCSPESQIRIALQQMMTSLFQKGHSGFHSQKDTWLRDYALAYSRDELYSFATNNNKLIASILQTRNIDTSDSILDLCSGHLALQRLMPFHKVDSLDGNPFLLEIGSARFKADHGDLSLQGKTLSHTLEEFVGKPISGMLEKYDAITMSLGLHYTANTNQERCELLQQIAHKLKDGGTFCFTVPVDYISPQEVAGSSTLDERLERFESAMHAIGLKVLPTLSGKVHGKNDSKDKSQEYFVYTFEKVAPSHAMYDVADFNLFVEGYIAESGGNKKHSLRDERALPVVIDITNFVFEYGNNSLQFHKADEVKFDVQEEKDGESDVEVEVQQQIHIVDSRNSNFQTKQETEITMEGSVHRDVVGNPLVLQENIFMKINQEIKKNRERIYR